MIIEIDEEVFLKLKELAEPFVDMTPNHVIRRLAGLSSKHVEQETKIPLSPKLPRERSLSIQGKIPADQTILRLREATAFVHSAFLTFLMDKHLNTKGNYKTSDIIPFFEQFKMVTTSGYLRNPWMASPYENKSSCQRTVEHFRQCRKFGCWGGRNTKANCTKSSCEYHPENKDGPKNRCDLRKGVIWKRESRQYPASYGDNYIEIVKKDLLNGKRIPLNPLLSVFYPNDHFDEKLIERFFKDFNMNEQEITQFFENK